jgi:dephospho-CoA kinase
MSKSQKTYTIAITASIGCGKSTVRRCLEELGVPVVDTDNIGHELLNAPNPIYRAVLDYFGHDLVDAPNGPINRKKLGAIIFSDPSAKEALEALLHPAIRLICKRRIAALNADIVAIEVPLLFEAGQQGDYDEVWAVLAESGVRLRRLIERDHISEAEAQLRIDAQWPQEKKAALANRIIDNSGTIEETKAQVVNCLARARVAARDAASVDTATKNDEYRGILRRFGHIGTEQALSKSAMLPPLSTKKQPLR